MTRKIMVFEVAMIAAVLAAGVVAYPHLPPQIATHWGGDLQPNGYSPKGEFFLIGPGLMAALTVFTVLGPWLSPRRFEVGNFQSTYELLMLVVFLAIAYFSCMTLWAGLGHEMTVGRAVLGGVCVLFIAIGNVMGKVRRNFFIGIKTPWTLASERVWNQTHRLAAKSFVVAGIFGLGCVACGLMWWPIYAMGAAAVVPVVYSLVLYKQLQRAGELGEA